MRCIGAVSTKSTDSKIHGRGTPSFSLVFSFGFWFGFVLCSFQVIEFERRLG